MVTVTKDVQQRIYRGDHCFRHFDFAKKDIIRTDATKLKEVEGERVKIITDERYKTQRIIEKRKYMQCPTCFMEVDPSKYVHIPIAA